MGDKSLPSLLDVIEAREKRDGGRESLLHLCYVMTTSNTLGAVNYHNKAMEELSPRPERPKTPAPVQGAVGFFGLLAAAKAAARAEALLSADGQSEEAGSFGDGGTLADGSASPGGAPSPSALGSSSSSSAMAAGHHPDGGARLTGCLLAQKGVLLHYLEAPAPAAYRLLNKLQAYQDKHPENEFRVLVSSEDCDERYFDGWYRPSSLMDRKATAGESEDGAPPLGGDDNDTEAAYLLLDALATLGEGLASLGAGPAAVDLASAFGFDRRATMKGAGKQSPKNNRGLQPAQQHWHEVKAMPCTGGDTGGDTGDALVAAACPSRAHLSALSKSEAFFTLDEYLAFFDAPVQVELDSEREWPYQPLVDCSAFLNNSNPNPNPQLAQGAAD